MANEMRMEQAIYETPRIKLVSVPELPLTEMGKIAGICVGKQLDDEADYEQRAKSCMLAQHGRVLEYVDVTFEISSITARVAREWYTHIGGSPTRLQESTRYMDNTNFEHKTPMSVLNSDKAFYAYHKCMDTIKMAYEAMLEAGIPKEDCAFVLPLGMKTRIIVKHNLRNLIDMCGRRLCTRAFWEYRDILSALKKELRGVSDEWAWIVDRYFIPFCELHGYCPEIKTCGKYGKLKREVTNATKPASV